MSSSSRGVTFPRGLKFRISAWLPVVIGAAVIAVESTTYFGSDHTSGPLRKIFEALFGHMGDALWERIHHCIRKCGHFVGYGLIGLAWLRAWWMTLPRSRFLTEAALALLGTALIAASDEWHQSFLPNRGSSVWDVLLDCSGALAMICMAYWILRRKAPERMTHAA